MPKIPVKSPLVETLRPFDVNENEPEEFPIVVDVPLVEDRVTFPDWFKLPESVVAPVTPRVEPIVVAPVTPRVPPTVALPVEASVVNDPAAGVLPPIAVLSIVPPVIVAPDEEKLFAVVGPFNETAPVPVLNVPVPFCEKFCEAERLVKLPAAAVAAPIDVPLIEPPVIVAPDEARLFAVVRPFKLAAPVTVREPPKVVAPLPTDNVLVPVTLVGPFRETTPVPVLSVVLPL
jgi:hypothetical protein